MSAGCVGRWANCLVAGGVVSRFLSGPGTRPLPLFGDLAEPSLTAGEGELLSGHGAGKNQDKRWVVLWRWSGARGGRFPCVCRVPGVLAVAKAGSKVSAFRFENHEKPKKNMRKNHKKTQKNQKPAQQSHRTRISTLPATDPATRQLNFGSIEHCTTWHDGIIKDFRRERRTAAASKSPTFSTHLPHTILPIRFLADNLGDNYRRITLQFTLQSTWHSPDH